MNSTRKISKSIRHVYFVIMALLLSVALTSWQSPFLTVASSETINQEALNSEESFTEDDTVFGEPPSQNDGANTPESTDVEEPMAAEIATENTTEDIEDPRLAETSDVPEMEEMVGAPMAAIEALEATNNAETFSDNSLRADPDPRATINGQCGTSAWSLNTVTGELRIGAGTLKSCDSASAWSWHSYRVYVKSVTFTGNVYTDVAAQSMFFNMRNLTTINYFNRLYTSNTTNISGMFTNCTSLTSITFPPSFNTAKVTDMSSLFLGCTSLASVNIAAFDTRSTTTMGNIFEGCSSLVEVQVGSLFALSSDGSLPSPSGFSQDGKLFSGNWKAASNNAIYLPQTIPSYVADTYRADVLNSSVSISGNPLERQTLTATISDAGSYDWVYQWSRSDSEAGNYIDISGANALTYLTTIDDIGMYLRFTATYNGMVIFSTIGPIEKGVPLAPTITAANLNSDGSILLEFTTAASPSNPYDSILVSYMTDSGVLEEYGELPCISVTSEAKTLTLGLSHKFEGETLPTMFYLWVKAKNAAGLSEWSNLGTLTPSPQISVTVPTASFGTVAGDGEIILHGSPQIVENTGTLDVKITGASFSQLQESHPVSHWICTLERDPSVTLWEGSSQSSTAVTQSPVIKPGNDLGLVWTGSMTNTDGIILSATPIDYGTITYTFGFASS